MGPAFPAEDRIDFLLVILLSSLYSVKPVYGTQKHINTYRDLLSILNSSILSEGGMGNVGYVKLGLEQLALSMNTLPVLQEASLQCSVLQFLQ